MATVRCIRATAFILGGEMKYRYVSKPSRAQAGMSPSELKTFIKRRGYRVHRDFFKRGSVARCRGRLYRFRWWAEQGFVVDISCSVVDFDRWANSVEDTISFQDWIERSGVE